MNPPRPIGRRDAMKMVALLGASLLTGCAREGEGTIKAAGNLIHSPDRSLAYREKSKKFATRNRRKR